MITLEAIDMVESLSTMKKPQRRSRKNLDKNYMKSLQAASRAQRGLSFPFKFAEGRDDIARTIFVEQFPPRLLASPGLPRRRGEGCPPGNQATHLAGEVLEIASLVFNGT